VRAFACVCVRLVRVRAFARVCVSARRACMHSDARPAHARSPPGVAHVHRTQDDYDWWSAHGQAPSAGKPLWLTLDIVSADSAARWRHLFFDDNIHDDPDASIVAVRARKSAEAPFTAVSGEATRALHGAVLQRVPTIRPVLEAGWFVEQIAKCEARLDALLEGRDERRSGSSLAQTLGLGT
jgi:hypothetical protein